MMIIIGIARTSDCPTTESKHHRGITNTADLTAHPRISTNNAITGNRMPITIPIDILIQQAMDSIATQIVGFEAMREWTHLLNGIGRLQNGTIRVGIVANLAI